MTSEPVPLPIMIGSRPAMMMATVMALGRTRSTAPSRMASSRSASLGVPTLALLHCQFRYPDACRRDDLPNQRDGIAVVF
jgi:hypothetical protein